VITLSFPGLIQMAAVSTAGKNSKIILQLKTQISKIVTTDFFYSSRFNIVVLLLIIITLLKKRFIK